MKKSLRFQLAFRFALTMAVASTAAVVIGHFALQSVLDRKVNESLQNVASIQAASISDGPPGEMHFHQWDLPPSADSAVARLSRYLQIWDASGESRLRSRFLDSNLPLDTAALETAVSGTVVTRESAFQGEEIRSLYYPLGWLGSAYQGRVLQVAAPLTDRNHTLRSAALFMAAVVILVTGGTFIGAWWLARRAVQTAEDIVDQAEGISATDLDQRITAHADAREYEQLVEGLNTMLDRIDAAFDAQRRFIGDASHELRSPLTAIRGKVEVALRRDRPQEEYREVLRRVLEESEHLSRIASDLLTLTRSEAGVLEPQLEETSLAEPVTSAVARLQERAEQQNIALHLEIEKAGEGRLDPTLIGRATRNLVENAVKFTPAEGHVAVRVDSRDGTGVLEVEDTGPGLSSGELEKVFERFYRADEARSPDSGTGLGLSIVQAVARAHGGEAVAEHGSRGGALFRLWIPLGKSDATPRAG